MSKGHAGAAAEGRAHSSHSEAVLWGLGQVTFCVCVFACVNE